MLAACARGRPAQPEDGDITQNPDSGEDDLLQTTTPAANSQDKGARQQLRRYLPFRLWPFTVEITEDQTIKNDDQRLAGGEWHQELDARRSPEILCSRRYSPTPPNVWNIPTRTRHSVISSRDSSRSGA